MPAPCRSPRPSLRWSGLLLFCSVTLWGPGAFAASLLEVYEDAEQNDPVLGAAEAGYEARRQLMPQARAALLPNIGVSASTSWNERRFPGPDRIDPITGLPQAIDDQEFNENGWQAQLRQPLFDLQSWFSFRSAQASVEEGRWSYEAAQQQQLIRVVNAYLSVLRAQDLLDSTEAEEAAVKRQLEQVQQRFDVGLVAITDVLESQAVYDNVLVRRIQADSEQDIFFESLRTLTGQTYDSLNRISADLPITDPEPLDESWWVQTALANNPNILAAEAQLEAAERAVRARQSEHAPVVDATVTESHSATGGTSFLGNEIDQTTYALSISLPIYQGGYTSARAKEARALANQARQLLVEQELGVSRDTRSLYRAVVTDIQRVRARDLSIKSAESALEATQTGYEVGTRNVVDVLQAQQRLFLSQFDYADARYSYVINLMQLKQVAGILELEDLERLNTYTEAGAPVRRVDSLRRHSPDTGS